MKSLLYSNIGIVLGNTLINIARRSLSKRRYLSFITKNQKIVNLIKRKRKPCNRNYSVPIINLSNHNLSNQEKQQLKLGLDYLFLMLHFGPSKFQNAINEIQSTVIFIVQKEYHQTLTKKSLWWKKSWLKKGLLPIAFH